MLPKSKLIAVPFAAMLACVAANTAAAEPGVTNDKILFGQSTALGGPASALGQGMQAGILAAFEEANRKGGVAGRKLELKSYDDGYEPDRAIDNTRKLIDQDNVIALIGEVGTPTSKAVQPIATDAKVPFIGPFTGAGFLRDASHGNIVNYRATYGQETEAWVKHLTEDLGHKRIAILYQDDSFGRVGLAGVTKALEKRGMSLVAEGTYKRNTTAVKSAVLKIRKAKPDSVVMVGAYKPIAAFIKLAKKTGIDATFVNISFVGSKALAKELGDDGAGVVITQVVPFPWDRSIPAVAQYQDALRAVDANAEPGFVSLEGYLVGRLTIMALEKMGGSFTRANFLKTVANLGQFSLGGVQLAFGPDDNQGSDQVFLTDIQSDGSFHAVDRLS
ncbi:MAG: ABC transporter substrate-binding protein, partial [Pseudomonadota bacterium]